MPLKLRKKKKIPLTPKKYNLPLKQVFGQWEPQEGEVGIEVECEGSRLLAAVPSYWRAKPDGSLRGNSMEYVLSKPVKRDKVLNFLLYLKKKLDENNAVINDSVRTSVHVHLNVQQLTFKQIYNFICLYLLFEDLLVEYAGPTRVGNLFCLRARDAEHLIDVLVSCAEQDSYSEIALANNIRYCSCNVAAIPKFGSVEFRALRGTVDPHLINTWVELLLRIKDESLNYDNPKEIIEEFSSLSPLGLFSKVFGEHTNLFGSNNTKIEHTLWESVRLIQQVAYATEWKKKEEEKTNGRVFSKHVVTDNINSSIDWNTVTFTIGDGRIIAGDVPTAETTISLRDIVLLNEQNPNH
jgi:Putative amidoligase enzyme